MKRFSLLLLVAILFAACTNDSIEELHSPIGTENYVPESITVGFEGDGDETRIQLQNGKTVWTKNDQVSVFYLSNANQKWQYYGETGSRTAELKRVDAGSGSTKINMVVVVYPYNEDYYINPESCNIKAFMPAEQTYLEDSYGNNGNIMISSSEYNQFSLKNVCGWLKLQLTGDAEIIKSIKVYGNNGEQVAGEMYIDSTKATATLASDMGGADDEENSAGGNLVFDDTILTEVTLNCGEGVELLPVATAFYIALPPQDFENGFTVEITDDSGYTMTQSTSKHVTIERNHIQPMTVFEFTNPNTPATPKPADNEIWYTATEKVEPYWDDANTYGVRLVTNTWDEATGKGVYTFAGDVTKVGAEAFLECNKLQSVTLPDSATEIGSNAFKNCDGLKEVTIGDGVTKIGSYAFYDCDALTTVSFGDSLETINYQAFYSCNNLQEIIIGGNVTTVGSRAFYECKKLTRAVIGDNVTSVGEYAFYGCSTLNNVIIGKSLTKINTNVFYNCSALNNIVIGDGITEIGSYAFRGCTSLQSIVIPDGVKIINSYAFQSCSKLESISIGNNIEDIDPNVFDSCDAIKFFYGKYATNDGRALIKDDTIILYAKASGTDYTIPNNITTIGKRAFYRASISSVTIPENVVSIEDEAFSNCTNLKKVYIKAINPPSHGSGAFSSNASGRRFYVYDEVVSTYKRQWGYSDSIYGNGSYEGTDTTVFYYTTNDGNIVNTDYLPIKENTYSDDQGKMVIHGSWYKIPEYAFYNKVNLVSITIPESITYISNYAFSSSWSLESVNIPDGVTYIGCDAFRGCKFSSVTIPNSVSDIGFGAFSGCSNLTSFSGKFAVDGGNALIVDNKFIAFAPQSTTADYTIPENVTIIGDGAFSESFNLKRVTIHDNVTSIGNDAFYACHNLNSIVVGRGVEEIGWSAFAYGCDQRTIYMKPTVPPTCEENAFEGWYDSYEDGYLKIYVPIASEYTYKSSWTKWSGNIHSYDFNRVQANYEIWYTSVDDSLISPYYYEANVLSNTYSNGFGVISFDQEITTIGESMFSGEDKLLSISLPESVTSIGDNAFSSCWNLSSITIPDSVEEIGESVFEGCNNIIGFKGKYAKDNGKILVINGVLKALAYLEVEQYTIPDYVTEIGSYAFYSQSNLRSVTIPNSVTKIGKGAFYQCSNITSITIPYSVTTIGDYAFEYCRSLTSITIPDSVTSIGSGEFEYCSSLTSIIIPDSVTTIGNSAFWGCSSLTSVTIGDSVTTIGDYAFEYCSSLTSITIPDSVTSIGSQAFKYCDSLTEFTGKFAEDNGRILVIDGCVVSFAPSGITEYTIPSTVTSIRDYTFYGCDNLISITIPSSVKSIGRQAFDYSDNLASIYCKAATPPTCSSSQFSGIASNFKIYVPVESVSAYKVATYWKNHVSAIVGYDFENGVVVE